MNGRKQKYLVVLLVVVISSFLIFTASFGGTMIFRTTAGQQEDQQNGVVVDSIENRTVTNQTGAAALSANLTQGDFETLSQDLTEARQASENNDTNTVLDELNSASGELFQVISRQFDPAHVEAMSQEFNPLQTHIDQTQEAALKDDHTRMLEELSAAESELLKITQTLPSSQE
jgi:hypothetical protein